MDESDIIISSAERDDVPAVSFDGCMKQILPIRDVNKTFTEEE